MQLIGMLDSPYVRRVAISLQALGLPFEHRSVSVFREFATFQAINPVVKAPTLVCDDGSVLMDSTLILEYAEAMARPRSLMPGDVKVLRRDLRRIGTALAACEKTVQIVYERSLRPPEKQHRPWLDRVAGQLSAAYRLLEDDIANEPIALSPAVMSQAGITSAVIWHFTQCVLPEIVPAASFPALATLSAEAETLREFEAAPHGDGTYRAP